MAEGIMVQFLETTSAKLSALPLVNGRFIFCTDNGAFYRETSTQRFLLSCRDTISLYMRASILNLKTLNMQSNIPMTVSNDRLVITSSGSGMAVYEVRPNAKDLNSKIELYPNVT